MSLLLLFGGPSAAAFTGTATITFSQTGAFFDADSLSGTATISFSQTGAFSGGFSNSATTTITFSQTGALLNSAKFSGTPVITFGQSGSLLSTSVLAVTATVTFSQTGAFLAATFDFPGSWYNGDGLVVVYGPPEGNSYPLAGRPLASDPPGKLIYGRSHRHGYRK